MPKLVDHDERRRLIGDAVITLAATEGLAGASMRRVAAEVGASLAGVQHYFPSSDALHEYAFNRIAERRRERIERDLRELGRRPTECEVLQHVVCAWIPHDEARYAECMAEAAYLTRWIGGAPVPTEGLRTQFSEFRDLMNSAAERGELADGIDPELEVRTLWALITSQAYGVITGLATADEAHQVLEYWFKRVFGPTVTCPKR